MTSSYIQTRIYARGARDVYTLVQVRRIYGSGGAWSVYTSLGARKEDVYTDALYIRIYALMPEAKSSAGKFLRWPGVPGLFPFGMI